MSPNIITHKKPITISTINRINIKTIYKILLTNKQIENENINLFS